MWFLFSRVDLFLDPALGLVEVDEGRGQVQESLRVCSPACQCQESDGHDGVHLEHLVEAQGVVAGGHRVDHYVDAFQNGRLVGMGQNQRGLRNVPADRNDLPLEGVPVLGAHTAKTGGLKDITLEALLDAAASARADQNENPSHLGERVEDLLKQDLADKASGTGD